MSQALPYLPQVTAAALLMVFLLYIGRRLGPRFLIRRIARLVFALFGVSFGVFILGYFAPYDLIYNQLGPHAPPGAWRGIRHYYGLDLPWYAQYGHYLNHLLHFNLGASWADGSQTVWSVLQPFIPVSATLALSSLALAIVFGIPLGIRPAMRANGRHGAATRPVLQPFSQVFFLLPCFVITPTYLWAMYWLANHGLPHLQLFGGWWMWDTMLPPIIIIALASSAGYLRFTRASMAAVLRQGYVRTARAKGISAHTVFWRHAVRNALLPLITITGPSIGFVVTGLFITENLFNIPGIGRESIAAIIAGDFPVAQGAVILLAVAVSLAHLASDVGYGLADPRVRPRRA